LTLDEVLFSAGFHNKKTKLLHKIRNVYIYLAFKRDATAYCYHRNTPLKLTSEFGNCCWNVCTEHPSMTPESNATCQDQGQENFYSRIPEAKSRVHDYVS